MTGGRDPTTRRMLPALVLLAGLPLWLARELAWWWTVAILLALLPASLPDLPSVAVLRGRQGGGQ